MAFASKHRNHNIDFPARRNRHCIHSMKNRYSGLTTLVLNNTYPSVSNIAGIDEHRLTNKPHTLNRHHVASEIRRLGQMLHMVWD